MPNFFDEEKYLIYYENLHLYLKLGLKLKKMHHVLEFNQSQWLKPYIEFNTRKNISRKECWQRWKTIVQINEQCCIWKNNGKLKKENQCKTRKQRKRLSYMSHKIFDNDLVATCKNKVT